MKVTEDPESAEKLGIHQRLLHRIAARALAEGTPLTPVQMRELESQASSKQESRQIFEAFEQENDWHEFLERISGLLRNAIAEDALEDPEAPARYDAMVHELEDRPASFTLWACCVPAIRHYKSDSGSGWPGVVILFCILALIVYMFLHGLKIH